MMLKALIKKQFLELSQLYAKNKRTGQNRSKAGMIGYLLLFVFVFLLLGLAIFGMTHMMGDAMLGQGFNWLYFAFMGLMTVLLGVFGSVFSTYAALYLSKDNDQLLSMPIPPAKILLSRMVSVWVMSLIFTAIAWIPTVIRFWISEAVTPVQIVFDLLLLLFLTLFVSALTCFFGWVVALISKKTKGKSGVTVIISLIFLGGYYYFYMHFMSLLTEVTTHIEQLSGVVKGPLVLFYLLGRAADGEIGPFIGFVLISLAAFALCWMILSRNFIRVVTGRQTTAKKRYDSSAIKSSGYQIALFKRELKRFTSSSIYMLNCGLGVVAMLAAAVLAIIKSGDIAALVNLISENLPELLAYRAGIVLAVMGLLLSMNWISAPSVSLEGKSFWIIRTLPVSSLEILRAKERLHIVINGVPAIIVSVILGVIVKLAWFEILLVLLIALLFVVFSGDIGLVFGILKANLSWTNETVPIKQNISILIVMFGNVLLVLALAAGAYFLRNIVTIQIYMVGLVVLFALLIGVLQKWLRTNGVKRFEAL